MDTDKYIYNINFQFLGILGAENQTQNETTSEIHSEQDPGNTKQRQAGVYQEAEKKSSLAIHSWDG